MRVTNKMLSNSFLTDMRTNLKNMQTIQQQITSGKEIRKPSDDPVRVARAMQLHTDINTDKQYKKNISDTLNWIDTSDTSLNQAGNVLQKIRELLVAAGNATYGPDERKKIKNEVNQKVDEFSQILNTNFDGRYLFAGSRGGEKPLKTTVDANGNTKLDYITNDPAEITKIGHRLIVEISPGVTMEYNVTANEVLEFNVNGTSKDIRNILDKIVTDLDNNNAADITGDDLQDITDAINNVLKVRSEAGAKQNRMESAKEKNTDETFNLTEILSRTEDIDITEKTMQYSILQTVYMASLQTSAKVLQPTLLDFLR